ncbi:virulence RhuM family protein [Gordonibacter sp.]|uniref:virulence RhuM family protein n=1 Tax=Gordonibacter sp. TaxID=1968902 RepID=UPI002FC88F05
MSNEELVLFESGDGSVSLPVQVEDDTVWLTQAQMAELFEKERSVVTKHINNAFKEGEVDRESNMQNLHIPSSDRPVTFYNLDVIISVGYRVKSQRGVEFRRWATGVLQRYVVEGQAVNSRRLEQLDGNDVIGGFPPALFGAVCSRIRHCKALFSVGTRLLDLNSKIF